MPAQLPAIFTEATMRIKTNIKRARRSAMAIEQAVKIKSNIKAGPAYADVH